MKTRNKSVLSIIVIVAVVLSLFSLSAICNMCASDLKSTDATSIYKKPATTSETSTTITTTPKITSGELKPPTIELNIYEGPTYSEESSVCYYRIEANVTGSPIPEVIFSKNDSDGSLGDFKCQINLENPSDTYTLIAVAKNSEGTDEDTIELIWGCDVEATELSDDTPVIDTLESTFEGPPLSLHPSNIGYIVKPSGINTETCIFGDSISNTKVMGFFGFNNLGSFSGRPIKSVTIKLEKWKFLDDANPDFFSDIVLYMVTNREIFPLDSGDWTIGSIIGTRFDYDDETLEFTDTNEGDFPFIEEIEDNINTTGKLEFRIYYDPNWETDLDGIVDGREYRKEDITLTIRFID